MNPAIKAHVFDAETALAWTREALAERDPIATVESLHEAHEHLAQALEEARCACPNPKSQDPTEPARATSDNPK